MKNTLLHKILTQFTPLSPNNRVQNYLWNNISDRIDNSVAAVVSKTIYNLREDIFYGENLTNSR
jgi:hypothetical protein